MMRDQEAEAADERQKWENYYTSLPSEELPEVTVLGDEFSHAVNELLPAGSRVLECGCGAGWQSLALARTGRYEIHLLDFSSQALEFARNTFARENRPAAFHLGDAHQPGEPEYDLVFNSGVVEHYAEEQQIKLLRGMASRSRRFVMVLAPNTECYWYWISRLRNTGAGGWPFGKEVPTGSLLGTFESAGLSYLGGRYFGRRWTEAFIRNLRGIPEDFRETLLQCHRSRMIPPEQACYLVAALGSVTPEPARWETDARSVPAELAEMRAALADALALCISGEQQIRNCAERMRELELGLSTVQGEIASLQQELQERDRRVFELGEGLRDSEQQNSALKIELGELGNRLEQLGRKLRDANEHVSAVHAGVGEYQRVLDDRLSEYRGQRAWKVMLAIRKAYTMLIREGWAGRLKLLTGSGPGLDRFDLSFPEVRNYLLPPPHGEQGDGWHGIGIGVAPSPAEQHPAQLHDIVVLAIIDFDFRFQRPQQIAAEYARRGHRVFWISPTRFLPPASAKPYSAREIRRNIWEVHLRGEQPDIYLGELSAAACAQLRKSIEALYRDWAISESCTLVQLPFWRRLSLALREDHGARIVYDCMDEWDSFENMGRFNVDEEKALAQECDVLAVTAAKLEQKFRARSLAPVLVRNAADFDFFQSGGNSPLLEGIPKPIVGYFGAIADWIDLDLIGDVARLRPQYSFVLVGQVFDRNVTELEALPNVHLLGNQPYDQIPPLLRGFDVCQIPFLRNQVTEATDPVKLYEYLSLGKPVVATDMAELRYCGELIYTANDAPGFARRLDAALGETDPAAVIRRIEFARKNSWAARVEALENAVRGVFPLVSILIVTYNSEEYIGPCLRSIQKNTSYPRVEVIVVDNASCDGTAAAVKQIAAADGRIRFLQLKTNTGFAAGNNAATAGAQGEFLILLNADTLVTPGWVGRLLRHLTRDASVGIVCAVTNFAGNEAKVNIDYQQQEGMERFAIRLARDRRDQALEVPVVPLFCAMLRRSIFERVGCLDAGYGIGMFEDDDLSTAIRRQGLRAIVAEDCFIHHFGQGSFAKLSPGEYERLFQENRRRFEAKWETEWIPHRPRPNVRPAHEERRFSPFEFLS